MTTSNIYTPYFYIIQHKITKIMYAGSRWAKGCHPDEFMKPDGYQTSSNTINDIIKEEGLGIFDILRIDTHCDGISPFEYESIFLQCVDCAKSDDWYNKHNNSGMAFGTEQYHKQLQKKYGVCHNSKIPSVKQSKIDNSKLKYGVDNISQSQEIKDKKIVTSLENWGVENASRCPEIRQKGIETMLEKYGVENASQCPEIQDKKVATFYANWGVSNSSQFMFLSIIETKKTYAKNMLSRYHPHFKQFY